MNILKYTAIFQYKLRFIIPNIQVIQCYKIVNRPIHYYIIKGSHDIYILLY